MGLAVLDRESAASAEAEFSTPQYEKRGHWRRPHFRMQPYGPHSTLRKMVFIGPVVVRPGRLGL
ncbi:protein of unknown function [Paraburkholderia kururiensis]